MDAQEIGGRYKVLERIGKGAMGVVYKAHDPVLDRVVAIKKMVAEIGDDEELRQRFYVEARAAARLNHRHIVTIYELEEVNGEIYIVMELLEGLDLATLLKRGIQLPLDTRLNLVAQLCEGLDYAHEHGIVHRDIKPGNLHISPVGSVKILDFGIARLASSKMTGTGALIGTPDYMSPEQVLGEEVDARSDLFAVGAVLYELVAGRKPFDGDSVASLLIRIAKTPHTPLKERAPDAPDALVALTDRLLAKDRNARPARAAQVVEELRAIGRQLQGRSDTAATAYLGGIVSEQTVLARTRAAVSAPPTPKPPASSRRASLSGPPGPGAADSNAKLASLALARGRALREAGDLAGAMEVFRSVLEVAPGNAEALGELQQLEMALRQATARPPASSVATAPGVAAPAGADAAHSKKRRPASTRALVAIVVGVLVAGGAAGGWYLWKLQGTATAEVDRAAAATDKPALPPGISPDIFEGLEPGREKAPPPSTVPASEPTAPAPAPGPASIATPPSPLAPAATEKPAQPAPMRLDRDPGQRKVVTPGPPPRERVAPPEPGESRAGQPPPSPVERRSPSRENSIPAQAEPQPPRDMRLPATRSDRPEAVQGRESIDPGTIDTLTGRRRAAEGTGIFNAAPSAAAAINRIKLVLDQYARALEQSDEVAARRLRENPTGIELRILETGKDVTFKFEDVRVESDGAQGLATARRVVAFRNDAGEKYDQDSRVSIRLIRRPTGWVITEIR